MTNESYIEVYPVGFFRDIKSLKFETRTQPIPKALKTFWRRFKISWKRKNYWNGYLAEWHYPPLESRHTTCGTGWTKRKALKRYGVHIAKSNLGKY